MKDRESGQAYKLCSEYFALFDPPAFASLKDPFVYGHQFPSLFCTLDLFDDKTYQLVGLFHLHQSPQNVSEQLPLKCPSSMT